MCQRTQPILIGFITCLYTVTLSILSLLAKTKPLCYDPVRYLMFPKRYPGSCKTGRVFWLWFFNYSKLSPGSIQESSKTVYWRCANRNKIRIGRTATLCWGWQNSAYSTISTNNYLIRLGKQWLLNG